MSLSYPTELFIEEAKRKQWSKQFIDNCVSYIKTLESQNYPIIFSIIHFSILLGIPSDELNYLIDNRFDNYSYFKIPKKKPGEFRVVMSPNNKIKYLQKWINFNILQKTSVLLPNCTAFRPDFSIKINAEFHQKSRYILKIDLLKFYDTITEKRVYGVFKKMGYAKNLAMFFAKVCTQKHGLKFWNDIKGKEKELLSELIEEGPCILPQGAPTSPMLANIIASKMDKRFVGLASKCGVNYSRYADDLTFSSESKSQLPSLKLIKLIIEEEGFFVNEEKVSLFKKGVKQYVTGLSITHGVNVSKKYRKKIEQHLYYCRVYGPKEHLEFLIEHGKIQTKKNNSIYAYQDWLYGHILFIKSINKNAGEKMLRNFNSIDWSLMMI